MESYKGKLYEIYNVGKADDPVNTRLNIRQVQRTT